MNQSGLKGGAIFFILSFWAAFLLFSIQPIISKLLLPLFGGVAAVWIVNLVFFTSFLLLGYLYAHFLILKLQPKWQIIVHFAVILAAGIGAFREFSIFQESLPALKNEVLNNFNFPALTLLTVLLKTIGLPYFVLATTSPIIQSWYGRAGFGAPYKLYSISNAGSLLAIAIYPFVVEPSFTVVFQSRVWLFGFLVFVLLLVAAGIKFLARSSEQSVTNFLAREPKEKISFKTKLIWLSLALLPAMMLLTVTTRITKGIAAVPFLWLLPLAVYLITFIVCFSEKKKAPAKFYAFIFIVLASLLVFLNFLSLHFLFLILAEILVFGAAAMFCHTKLFESRPPLSGLTFYYLYISTGGALGTVMIGLVAPAIFYAYYEYTLVLAIALILALYLLRKEIGELFSLFRKRASWLFLLVALAFIFNLLYFLSIKDRVKEEIILRERNFFGTLEVRKRTASYGEVIRLMNGKILHGTELMAPEKNSLPTSYYSEDSGVGLLMRAKQKNDHRLERVGIVGLGAGTMAAYCRLGDIYTFYDINPAVVEIANQNFSFLKQCADRGGEVKIKIGDARLVLEKELIEAESKLYDILVLDAFSDDAIPVHLLTKEAMKIYLERLAPDGVLAVHISNRYLNLKPVLKGLAEAYNLDDAIIENNKSLSLEKTLSSWVLLTRDKNLLADETLKEQEHLKNEKNIRLWTDQFNNLLPLIK
ncbi:MAG: fused MFS/spermidine synthase [bacterium]|nr:fused MFS/spermidine synthase [bacterium]